MFFLLRLLATTSALFVNMRCESGKTIFSFAEAGKIFVSHGCIRPTTATSRTFYGCVSLRTKVVTLQVVWLDRRANVRAITILPALLVGATLALSVTAAAAWWQFAMNGPNGERQISPHFETEEECKNALKITEAELAKKYPDRYPLVGSCEQYR
jgi:hypothetical protein